METVIKEGDSSRGAGVTTVVYVELAPLQCLRRWPSAESILARQVIHQIYYLLVYRHACHSNPLTVYMTSPVYEKQIIRRIQLRMRVGDM